MVLIGPVAMDAIKSELVLDVHHVGGGSLDRPSDRSVTRQVALADPPLHFGPVGAGGVGLVDGRLHHADVGIGGLYGRDQIGEYEVAVKDPTVGMLRSLSYQRGVLAALAGA